MVAVSPPAVVVMHRIALPTWLWNDPLSVIPYGIGYDAAILKFLLNGTRFCRSSQKRIEFGLSGDVQFTLSCRSNDSPPNSWAPRPGRARNSTLYAL